ncbi:MAG TPA: isoprenylcysteine carboxylmethyltransferase family protein [Pseudomonadales bacterium]|nr:isoprenylcysteine carboxylmethyltransferase family protein [Pseudomonadales bacterium]
MKNLENKIPPPVVAILFGFCMWLLFGGHAGDSGVGFVRALLILLVFVAGGYFSLAGVLAFKKAKTTVNPLKPETATSMVTSGVYQITRNPMYVGFTLFLMAWAIYLASFLSLLGVMGFVLYINRFQIIPEERAMRKVFGDAFLEYSKQVRRWL